MNTFQEEFKKLLIRYSSIDIPVDNQTSEVPILTNQQILNAIHESLRSTLNINLQNVEANDFKTPANEIIITTPDAPEIMRVDSQSNTFQNSSGKNSNHEIHKKISDVSKNAKDKLNITSVILEDNKKKINNGSFDKNIKNEIPDIESTSGKNIIYNMIEEAHKDSVNAVKKLEEIRELLIPDTRLIRRLSAIMSLPILKEHQKLNASTSSSSKVLTLPRSKHLRRSLQHVSDVPVTPTSSRLGLVREQPVSATSVKKTIVAAPRVTNKVPGGTQARHSIGIAPSASIKSSNSTAAITTKSSPIKSVPKNPKYIHVQSTIPKPISTAIKRKPQ